MGFRYNPALDGLRAIAVLAVIAYHADLPLPAGFVGVDVFFVISGYLITRLLHDEIQSTGRIDFKGFYARRARRILPALAVVVLSTLAFAMNRGEGPDVARSVAAAGLFVANFFFQMQTGGYWSADSHTMPLLHLWSLSVEEQFYLAWPIVLILAKRRPVAVLWGVAIVSFIFAEALLWWQPSAAFYQTPARAWELAVGGLVALGSIRAKRAWIGLVIVLVACVVPMTRFPGSGALPAVVGTSWIIAALHAGERAPVLEWKPLVGVGLISYSLYLWHWPLFVIGNAGSLSGRLTLCIGAIVLSIASYRYVETPARRMRMPDGRTVKLGFAVAISMTLVACALVMRAPERPLATRIAKDRPRVGCRYVQTDTNFPKCSNPNARIAVWGDSMAYSWRPAVERLGLTADFSRDACPPFLEYRNGDGAFEQRCVDFNHQVSERVVGIDTLVITALWRVSSEPKRAAGLRRTLDAVAPRVGRVLVIGPSPRMRNRVPRCIQMSADCAIPRREFDETARPDLAVLKEIAERYPNVSVIDVSDRFCTQTECPPIRDGVPMYWDSHHVSYSVSSGFDLR